MPYSWIWLAFLVSIASFIIQLRLGQWRVREEATSYAILLVSQTAITILASLWLVAIEHKGAFGRVMGLVVSGAILGIFSIYSLKKMDCGATQNLVLIIGRNDLSQVLHSSHTPLVVFLSEQ